MPSGGRIIVHEMLFNVDPRHLDFDVTTGKDRRISREKHRFSFVAMFTPPASLGLSRGVDAPERDERKNLCKDVASRVRSITSGRAI